MSRACDKCFMLKTQCNGCIPCARCTRLGLECALNRPVGRRGRPKKNMVRASRRESTSNSVGTEDDDTIVAKVDCPPPGRDEPPPIDGTTVEESLVMENGAETPVAEEPRPVSHTDSDIDMSVSGMAWPAEGSTGGHGDLETPGREGAWMAAATLCQVYSDQGSGGLQFPVFSQSHSLDPPMTITAPLENGTILGGPNRQLDELEHLGLDGTVASTILEYLLSRAVQHGPTSILSDLPLDTTVATGCFYGDPHPKCPLELTLALLAMAVEFYPSELPHQIQQNRDLLIDTLRIEFLRRMPVITWKSTDVNCYQPLALTLASFTWCRNEQLAVVAAQWNGIAHLLLNALPTPPDSETQIFHNQVRRIVEHQNVVLILLQGLGSSTKLLAHNTVRPPQTESDGDRGFPNTSAYSNLFVPLFSLLDRVCQLPGRTVDSNEAKRIYLDLEEYYLSFPRHLLEFAFLTQAYQAEAMIWLHGIFIISYVGSEVRHVLTAPDLPDMSNFYSAFEHSLLLSEVLPTLLALDPELTGLSPATVHLIILSSAVTALTIWLLHMPSQEEGMQTCISTDIPLALTECTRLHCQTLQVLERATGRFGKRDLAAVHKCLSTVADSISLSAWSLLQNQLISISHNLPRSDGAGIGIFPQLDVMGETRRREAVDALCTPTARACQPGCFDLSIQF